MEWLARTRQLIIQRWDAVSSEYALISWLKGIILALDYPRVLIAIWECFNTVKPRVSSREDPIRFQDLGPKPSQAIQNLSSNLLRQGVHARLRMCRQRKGENTGIHHPQRLDTEYLGPAVHHSRGDISCLSHRTSPAGVPDGVRPGLNVRHHVLVADHTRTRDQLRADRHLGRRACVPNILPESLERD